MRVGEEKTRYRLLLVDLVDMSIKPAVVYKHADVGFFEWLNDDRLIYSIYDGHARPGQRGKGGTFVINRDGTGERPLPHAFPFMSAGLQKDEFIYVEEAVWGSQRVDMDSRPLYVNLYRMNTLNDRKEIVPRPAKSQMWMLDYKGEPRLTAAIEEGRISYHYRNPADGQWRQLATMGLCSTDPDTWSPVQFGPDGTLYVTSHAGQDKEGLYRLDLATGKIDPKPIVALQDFDFNGGLLFTDEKLVGIRFTSDAKGTIWLDEKFKAIQADLDAKLPATANHLSIPRRASHPWILVVAQSATSAGVQYLYNRDTGTLNKLGDSNPRLNPALLAPYDMVRIKARDGLEIPTWVTIPKGSSGKNLPTIMYVHGGPHIQGVSWKFDREIQFLASRGYAVVQPQFRGTKGYGSRHYQASFKQWGKAMQDDIADAAHWAIKQGIADPKRICIMGASYGGYSTLMGLINDPDLYKCGVSWVGVTDIMLMYNGHWSSGSDFSALYKQYGMPDIVGDPVKDLAQLKATSPIEQAHRLTQPLMMGYGGLDVRVPPYHGRLFQDALAKHNKKVDMIVYNDEGHGWYYTANNVDWWNKVASFLNEHIGSPK